VEAAIGVAAQSRCMALGSAGKMWRHRLTMVILPPSPPSLQRSTLFFNGIGHGLRCKRMIPMEFFADNRQQRGYGRLPGGPQVLISAMK